MILNIPHNLSIPTESGDDEAILKKLTVYYEYKEGTITILAQRVTLTEYDMDEVLRILARIEVHYLYYSGRGEPYFEVEPVEHY